MGGKNKNKKNHQMVMRVPLISSANEMAPMFFSVTNLLHMYIYFVYVHYLYSFRQYTSVLVFVEKQNGGGLSGGVWGWGTANTESLPFFCQLRSRHKAIIA